MCHCTGNYRIPHPSASRIATEIVLSEFGGLGPRPGARRGKTEAAQNTHAEVLRLRDDASRHAPRSQGDHEHRRSTGDRSARANRDRPWPTINFGSDHDDPSGETFKGLPEIT